MTPKGISDFLGQDKKNAKGDLVARQLEIWQKKLIDFSKRNQLLYFRPRQSLSIEIRESAEEIFRKLVLEAKSLQFRAMVASAAISELVLPPDPDEIPPGEDFAEAFDAGIDESNLDTAVLGLDFDTETSLQADKDERSLDQSLSKLRNRAKASLQEQGVNILYLALYFLEWQESPNEEPARSPLFLVPVSIERRGLSGVYRLNLIDDEIRINPTLSYKLLRDFGIDLTKLTTLGDNPDNLDAIDNLESLQALVTEIQSLIGNTKQQWRVVDDATLSLFSFAKLALYKDLEDHRAKITEHPVVRQIAGELVPAEEFGSALANLIEAKQIDKQIDANVAQQILDADSSQQEAIYAAKSGQSFVLQGPPGTGKSQTISNIIAEALAQSKKILFVSEKKAALDVVVNRLKQSKLDNFCLEIHGSQQKKSDIVENLRSSLESIKSLAIDSKRSVYIEDINRVKEQIQMSIDDLHQLRSPLDMSLYEIYGELSRLQQLLDSELPEADRDITFTIKNIERIGQPELAEIDYLFKQLEKKDEILSSFHKFPWRNASVAKLSFELENDIKSNFLEFQRVLRRLKQYADPISVNYFGREVRNLREFKWLAEACKLALQSPFPRREWLNKSKIQEVTTVAIQAKSEHEERNQRRQSLLARYSQGYLELDHNAMLAKFSTRYTGLMRFLNLEYWRDVSKIKKLSLYNEARDLKTMMADLEQAVMLDKQTSEINDESTELSFVLGDFYQHFDTNWQETLTAIKWVQKVLDRFETGELPPQLAETITNPEDFQDFKQQAEELISAYEVVKFQLRFYREIFPNPNLELNKLKFDDLISHLEELITGVHKIEDWLEFKDITSKAEQLGFKPLIDNLCAMPSENNTRLLQERFLAKFYELWADKIEMENPCLRKFSGQEQRLLIQKFVDLDQKQITKVNAELAKQLSMDWIEYASNPLNQEAIQVLQAEVNKKKRHKPIRLLLKEIPELLQTLKPCWMMSPLTVSQLIDTTGTKENRVHFDLIIFDEASQIRTEDAISSIYRGRQLILAGDTNQLPPTNFFSYIEDKDDGDYEENHFESVLDECSVFLPNRTLNWHYRSRHESLISFSNYYIYDNKLITFPSPMQKAQDFGVHFELVEAGRYEKGSRFNRIEAKVVAQAIVEHYLTKPERSLGVIAFSEAQQDAIERELATLLRKNSQLEQYFNEDSPDSFFIKNLESVQGDERDEIYFSIGYARDRKGTLSHNFGPLNREGGHRRLNVAITRARYKLKVFSSITAADIDLERTSAQGAVLLKKYLAYAQNSSEQNLSGDQELLFESRISQGKDNSLAVSIKTALEARGYKATRLLGSSDYRIDLAVASADDEDNYLLAIETDGPVYQSASTVRDRERLRRQVLESLGWKVHRVYARDWVRNPKLEFERILALL